MRTDLVGASRNQPDTAERKGTRLTNYRNLRDDLLIALALPRMDAHFVAFFTVLQPRYKTALRRRAHRDSQIFLAHHIIADDGV